MKLLIIAACIAGAGCAADSAGDDVTWADGGQACSAGTVLYLNPDGGRFGPGDTDSRANTSEILERGPVTAPPFPRDPSTWDQVVACTRAVLGAYDVVVTDDDPGATEHLELVVTTLGADLGLPWARSIAPWSCAGTANGLGFVFAGALPDSATAVCMTALGDFGHMLGLEHVTACDDIMSESPGCDRASPARRFSDADVPCGLLGATTCECTGRETQNSHQLLIDRVGICRG